MRTQRRSIRGASTNRERLMSQCVLYAPLSYARNDCNFW